MFSNRTRFPNVIRTINSDAYMAVLELLFVRLNGWQRIGVIHGNDTWTSGLGSGIIQEAKNKGVEVVNPESMRQFPCGLVGFDESYYKPQVEALFKSKARIVFCACWSEDAYDYIFPYLHDLGGRAGDFIWIASEWIYEEVVKSLPESETRWKDVEIIAGSLQYNPKAWVGDYGQEIFNQYQKVWGELPHWLAAFVFDAALMLGNALEYTLQQGLDYKNYEVLNKALRTIKMTGVTGKVSIEAGSNDPFNKMYEIVNVRDDDHKGVWEAKIIGTFCATCSIILELQQEIMWGDGTTNKQADHIVDIDCPFRSRDIEEFNNGKAVCFSIIAVLGIISFIFSGVSWRIWRSHKIDFIKEKAEMNAFDGFYYVEQLIIFIQIVAVGPNIDLIWQFADDYINITVFDFKAFVNNPAEVYQSIFNYSCACSVFFVAMLVFLAFRLDVRFYYISALEITTKLVFILFPFYAKVFYLPIFYNIADIFMCLKGSDMNRDGNLQFTESYVQNDCNMFCWKDEHLKQIIYGLIFFIFFLSTSTYFRPIGQAIQTSTHIQESQEMIIFVATLQMLVVVYAKTIGQESQIAFSIVYTITLACFIGLVSYFRTHNVKRTKCIYLILASLINWLALITTISLIIDKKTDIWIAVVIAGWIVIMAIGVYFYKYKLPEVLFRKVQDNTLMFRFAFKPWASPLILIEFIQKHNIKTFNIKGAKSQETTINVSIDDNSKWKNEESQEKSQETQMKVTNSQPFTQAKQMQVGQDKLKSFSHNNLDSQYVKIVQVEQAELDQTGLKTKKIKVKNIDMTQD